MEKFEGQNCTPNEIEFFENYFLDGDKKVKMLGVSWRLRKAYEDYYAYRIELNGEDN